MTLEAGIEARSIPEAAIIKRFLSAPDEESFTTLFRAFTPQLLSFFRARGCDSTVSEDLAQEVMLSVHRNVTQVRHQRVFRAWLFKIARNALYSYYNKRAEHNDVTLDSILGRVPTTSANSFGTEAFEFSQWLNLLNPSERLVMRLRYIEQWEYHEIAAAQAIPIGTVQWRVSRAKKKLAPHLTAIRAVA
jgi:RNA polymerase sigma-70 factor (ECF subfamily)